MIDPTSIQKHWAGEAAQWVRKAIAVKLEVLSWIPMAYIVEKN